MTNTISIVLAMVALVVAGVAVTSQNDAGVGGTSNFSKMSFIEGFYAGDGRQVEVDRDGELTYREKNEAITDDDTVTTLQSGTTFYVSGATATSTLPAVTSSAGVVVRYVVGGALSGDFVVASAEGDNIEGSAIVAGAVVDCDAEDKLTFVADGENLGDFVELRSNGTNWYLTQSNVLTSAKLTCTDPS